MRILLNWLLLLAWIAIILSTSNDTMSSPNTGSFLARILGFLTPGQLAAVNFLLRKLTHIVAYGILGALAFRAVRRTSVGVPLAIACAVAITDETLQATTMLRGGNAGDVLLDTIAAAIFILFLRRRE
ncbi:MAG TPA: VanZ family protein [Thermoanaerobaculia bacterium]|nr:VanZ family protein [Thermoanaerobaculia bacterium]